MWDAHTHTIPHANGDAYAYAYADKAVSDATAAADTAPETVAGSPLFCRGSC